MCGRFALTLPPEAMARIFEAVPGNDLPEGPNLNVRPTQTVAVVRGSEDGPRRLSGLRWGFLPHWYKDVKDGPLLINARAETVAEKPAFRAAARARRCLIPATGFYEWHTAEDGKTKTPWLMSRADGEPLALAGIWQDWEHGGDRLTTCAIVTCAASREMAALHHRMPVIVEPGDWPLWLGEAGHGAAALMRPAPEGTLSFEQRAPG